MFHFIFKFIYENIMILNNIIFFDIDDQFIQEAKKLEKYGISSLKIDAKNIINTGKIDFIVSPANSFGFMNGGIDREYTKIFENIQNFVHIRIKGLNMLTNSGKHYLPIGSAITIQTRNSLCPNLICAPTMFLPSSIEKTNNVFFCFLAIIHIAKNNPNSIIACPGLGTGVGQLTSKYTIGQIEIAIKKYDDIINSLNYRDLIKFSNDKNIILKRIPCKQKNNFINREIA